MTVVINGTTGITSPGGDTSTSLSTTTLTATTVNGITVGKGAGAVSYNTVVGSGALAANSTGNAVTAFGYGALAASTVNYNTAVGRLALTATSTGVSNTGVGSSVLQANTTGAYNTAIGDTALASNTTASNNTAVGYQAGYTNSTNVNCTFVGYQAGYASTADTNTFVGRIAGTAVTTGGSNTFVGDNSGGAVTTGAKNTVIGRYNGNQGGLDIRTANNYIVLSDGDGNPRMYFNGSGQPYLQSVPAGAGTYPLKYNTTTFAVTADTSSRLVKENIEDSPYGLSEILQLKSRKYFRIDDKKTEIGLVADEVIDVLPEFVPMIKKSFITGIEGDDEIIAGGVHYDKLVSVLIKAVQELKAEFDAYKEAHP